MPRPTEPESGTSIAAGAFGRRGLSEAVYWCVALALLIPITASAHFPSEDGLAHLAWTEVFRSLGSGGSAWTTAYARSAEWNTPNLAYFVLQYGLGALVDPHLAQRIILAVTVLAMVAASRALAIAATGTLTLGAFASLLLVHSSWLYGGYLSFLLGVPVLVASLALVLRVTSGRSVALWRASAALASLGIIGFYCHLIVGALFLLLVSVAAIAAVASREQARWSRGTALGAALVPIAILFASYLAHGSLGGGVRWEPPVKTVARFVGLAFVRGFAAPGPTFWIALAAACVVFVVLTIEALRRARGVPRIGPQTLPLALAMCLVLLYAIVPDGVGDGYNLKGRLQFVMWAWLLPTIDLRAASRLRSGTVLAITGVLLWQVTSFTRRARAFDAMYATLVARARALPPGTLFDRRLDYEHANFDGSFLRVLAHAPEELAYHCGCVLVAGYHPSTPFYWVRALPVDSTRVRHHVMVRQLPGADVAFTITADDVVRPIAR